MATFVMIEATKQYNMLLLAVYDWKNGGGKAVVSDINGDGTKQRVSAPVNELAGSEKEWMY